MDNNWVGRGVAAVAALALLLAGAWWMGWLGGPAVDPQVQQLVEEVRERNAQQQASGGDTPPPSPGREEFRQRMEGLSEEQRASFFQQSVPIFAAMMEKRFDAFLAMSPEEQRREMDKRIDEMEAARRKASQAGEKRPDGPPGGGPWGGDPKRADEMRKKMLDMTTPEQRAKFETVMNMFNERRQQRGLEPVGPGRGRF
jgi:alkanesulfonate monooxygenase SsuD/methylene tetrahydromethanopterin reductase-like flavin-dependent oxidoreductase (luciferase family)